MAGGERSRTDDDGGLLINTLKGERRGIGVAVAGFQRLAAIGSVANTRPGGGSLQDKGLRALVKPAGKRGVAIGCEEFGCGSTRRPS